MSASNNPLKDPTGFMKWKQRMFGFKGKPFDLMNSKLVDNIDGSTDLVQVVTPPMGDVYVCSDCLNKFATLDGFVGEEVVFALSGKCFVCGRPVWALLTHGKKVYRVRRIQLSLKNIWRYLGGQKSKSAKYAGSRLW